VGGYDVHLVALDYPFELAPSLSGAQLLAKGLSHVLCHVRVKVQFSSYLAVG